jgi:hypothetical protein
MIPQQIGIAATFNTETAKKRSEISAYKHKTIDKLPNQEVWLFNWHVSPPNLKTTQIQLSTHSFYLSILLLVN